MKDVFLGCCHLNGPRVTPRPGRLGDVRHLDEVFVNIQGQRRYLWRPSIRTGSHNGGWVARVT
jgi:hypothetical protein